MKRRSGAGLGESQQAGGFALASWIKLVYVHTVIYQTTYSYFNAIVNFHVLLPVSELTVGCMLERMESSSVVTVRLLLHDHR